MTRIRNLVAAIIFVVGFAAAPVAAAPLEDADAATERHDYATALRLLHPFADQGHAGAQRILGNMYATGRGVTQDYAEAAKWYQKAVGQGDPIAPALLGLMYAEGKGVPQDYAEAVKLFRKAADQGYDRGQYFLGMAYEKGQGVPQDYGEALKWLQKAADQGYANAQHNLGVMYDQGLGVPRSQAEAAKWYRKAAEQGDDMAEFNIGSMYANGQGVPQDLVQAYMWFSLSAAAQRDQRAIKARDVIAPHMTLAQIEEAQKLLREWKPSTKTTRATTTVPATTTTTTPARRTEHNLFWDSVVADLKVLTYWAAGGAVGCLSMLLMPILQIAAMAVFTLTLSPIIFGFAQDADWSFPWRVITLAPGPFLKLLGALVVVSFGMAFIPLGRMQSLQTLVLGGIALTFVLGLLEAINPGGFVGHIKFIPDFWFVVGLLVVGGLMSWIGTLVAAVVASPLEMVGEGLGTLFVIPIAAIFGFIPMFIYGAWLGAQIRGGF